MKHLHVFSSANSYFPLSFIPFVEQFAVGEHYFLVRHDAPHLHALPHTIPIDFDRQLPGLVPLMGKFRHIWIHSLFNEILALTLVRHEILACRSAWVMWGGELYNGSEAIFSLRRILTPLLRMVALFTPQEAFIFRQTLGEPKAFVYVFYPNPLPAHCLRKAHRSPTLSPAILLGHSAWPSERHRQGLKLLHASSLTPVKAFLPLSYGDGDYATALLKEVSFPEIRRIPLLQPLSPLRYGRFLSHMDAALMLQQRQCALSTIYALVYMRVPVYIESSSVRQYLQKEHGIALHAPESLLNMDAEEILLPLHHKYKERASRFFDMTDIARQWNTLFLRED